MKAKAKAPRWNPAGPRRRPGTTLGAYAKRRIAEIKYEQEVMRIAEIGDRIKIVCTLPYRLPWE
jgi:hypothetical protein